MEIGDREVRAILADLTSCTSFSILAKIIFQNEDDVLRDIEGDFLSFLEWYGLSKSELVWAFKQRFKVGANKLGAN